MSEESLIPVPRPMTLLAGLMLLIGGCGGSPSAGEIGSPIVTLSDSGCEHRGLPRWLSDSSESRW